MARASFISSENALFVKMGMVIPGVAGVNLTKLPLISF